MCDEPEGGKHEVVVVNDTLRPVAVEITIHCGADSLLRESVVVPANGRIHVGTVPTSEAPVLYRIEWRGEGVISRNHYLAGSRPFEVAACREWYEKLALRKPDQMRKNGRISSPVRQ